MNIALIIGINDYINTDVYPKLHSAVRDAKDVARKLTELKFDVECSLDDDKDTIHIYWCNFIETITKNKYDVAVVYFAGHGVIANNYDCLLMKEAIAVNPTTGLLPEGHSLKVQQLITDMRANGDQINILIIDACRHISGIRGTTTGDFGVTSKIPYQTFIAYSTSPGRGAKDGTDTTNSPFAEALLKYIGEENLPIELLFKNIRKEIQNKGIDQLTWENSCLVDDFCFNHGQTDRHYDSIYDKSCFTSDIGDRDEVLVRTLRMNSKDNLIGKLSDLKKTLDINVIFGAGKAIAGLMKQHEIDASDILKYNKIGLFTGNYQNHLLNGILYGFYFDRKDHLVKADGRDMNILDAIDKLCEHKDFISSVRFIRKELEPYRKELFYIPGEEMKKVEIEIEHATEGNTEDGYDVWVIEKLYVKDEMNDRPITEKTCMDYTELRNAIRDRYLIPLSKLKCQFSKRINREDLFIWDEIDIADILNDYFVDNCISDMDDICHHYEYVGVDDYYIQHIQKEEDYLRVKGSFSINAVVYLDSEEEIKSDDCVDGTFDIVLENNMSKWSVIDVEDITLNLSKYRE